LDEASSLVTEESAAGQRVRAYRLSVERLETFLAMLRARDAFDFAGAKHSLDRLRTQTADLIDYRLYPNPSGVAPVNGEYGTHLDQEARLLWWRGCRSYVERFWAPCVESGHERLSGAGELVVGCPDEWDFLIDATDVGESAGWFRDGRVGGNWQRLRTTTASWSDQGLHYYKGVAWYRTQVDIPDRFEGRKVYLWFGGVDEKAKVWLNGQLLGTSVEPGPGLPGAAGTFKPFELDATAAIRYGQANAVAVKITNARMNEVGTGGIVSPVMFWARGDL